jgi:stage V sporulation protein R
MSWTIDDLEKWDEKIRERVNFYGLSCYPQDFEICDHADMIGYMAYHGMPAHYPHWSYGKSYERLETLYKYGVSGLPYEMVINANPSLAYLMKDNSLLLQILTIAHVYGHNDFFRNNILFQATHAEHTMSMFKAHAGIVRSYIEDPSIGIDKVEAILDAAHALSLHRSHRYIGHKETRSQQIDRLREKYFPKKSVDNPLLQQRQSTEEQRKAEDAFLAEIQRIPIDPDPDILIFIAENNPLLSEWERNLLRFADEDAKYFLPQMETKIMNEGWASYWHKRILDDLELSEGLRTEFAVRHNQVLRPHPGSINPYHLGFTIWNAVQLWFDGSRDSNTIHPFDKGLFLDMKKDFEDRDAVPVGTGTKTGQEAIFSIRASDRDTSFLQRFLTLPIMQQLDLFSFAQQGEKLVIDEISDTDGWRKIKQTLIGQVGINSIPVIRVLDANAGGERTLLLEHVHDGRDLELSYAEPTLAHIHRLWGRTVVLNTLVEGNTTALVYGNKGFSTRTSKK